MNKRLLHTIEQCAKRHSQQFGAEVAACTSIYDGLYTHLAKGMAESLLRGFGPEKEIIEYDLRFVADVLKKKSWFAWYLYQFTPVLALQPSVSFGYTLIAYNALHLLDDSIDNHRESKHIRQTTYFGDLLKRNKNEREAAALNAMVGMLFINESVSQLEQLGDGDTAERLLRLSGVTYGGMLAELTHTQNLTEKQYWKIIKRKAVAYQMMLEHHFFKESKAVFTPLISCNAKILKLAQLVDDLTDWDDDLQARNFGMSLISGMTREKLMQHIEEALTAAWQACEAFEPPLRNALAKRLQPKLEILNKQLSDATAHAQ